MSGGSFGVGATRFSEMVRWALQWPRSPTELGSTAPAPAAQGMSPSGGATAASKCSTGTTVQYSTGAVLLVLVNGTHKDQID